MRFPLVVIREVASVIDTYADKPFIPGYRISPEEIETPGIRLEDSLAFAQALADTPVDYLHLSMGSYKRTSLNQPDDKELLLTKFVHALNNKKPLIGIGSVERPEDAEEVINAGAALVAIGREFIREPKWVQTVFNCSEKAKNTGGPKDLLHLYYVSKNSSVSGLESYLAGSETFGSKSATISISICRAFRSK